MAPSRSAGPRRVAALLVLAAAAYLLLFHDLGGRSLWGSEGRWAEIAREMKATGDYLVPRINGRPYRDKPVLSYHLIVALTPLTGGRVTETTARLPSALAAAAALLLVLDLGRLLWSLRAGLLAAFLLVSSYSVVLWGRTASADMLTMTGVLLTLWIFVRFEESRSRAWVYPLFLSMALNSLTKGLLGFVLPMAVLVPYAVLRGRRDLLLHRHAAAALVLSAAVYAAPFLAEALAAGSGDSLFLVFRENVVRFFAPFDHREPWYFYLYTIFPVLAPWSLFLPGAAVHAAGKAGVSARGRLFLFLYLLGLLAFFSLSGSKRGYYLLPLLPAAVLLVGGTWSDLCDDPRRDRAAAAVVPALALAALLGAAAWILARPPLGLAPAVQRLAPGPFHAALVAAAAAAVVAAAVLWARARPAWAPVLVLAAVVAVEADLLHAVVPRAEAFRGLPAFCRAVNRQGVSDADLGVLRQRRRGDLFFYLHRGPVPAWEEPAAAMVFLADPRRRLIVEERDLGLLRALGPVEVVLAEAADPLRREPEERYLLVKGRAAAGR